MNNEKEKKANGSAKGEKTLLSDEQLNQASGGMKFMLLKTPKFFSPILKLIFKIKDK